MSSCAELRTSQKLKEFLDFQEEAVEAYKYYYEKVNECDKLKCDLLHKIELSTYKDRNEEKRLQTQLKYCLRDRRYFKDRVEELEPFVSLFLSKEKEQETLTRNCNTAINHMKQALGGVRKAESYHASRTYKPRILKDTFGE
jgi:hypothetical protein